MGESGGRGEGLTYFPTSRPVQCLLKPQFPLQRQGCQPLL